MGNFETIQVRAQRILEAALRAPFQWSMVQPPAPEEGGTATGYSGRAGALMVLAVHYKSDQREGYDVVVTSAIPFMIVHVPPEQREAFFKKAESEYAVTQN